jgi:hypothetical protein
MKRFKEIKYIVIDIDPIKLSKKLKTETLLGFKNFLRILAIMIFRTKHAHYLCVIHIEKTYGNKYDYATRV